MCYSVQRATYENGPFAAVASNLVETSYTDTNVTNGTSYYYKITAKTKAGTSESNVLKAVPRTPVDGQDRYEAEDGMLKGTIVESSGTGFSGTGYVTNFHNAGIP